MVSKAEVRTQFTIDLQSAALNDKNDENKLIALLFRQNRRNTEVFTTPHFKCGITEEKNTGLVHCKIFSDNFASIGKMGAVISGTTDHQCAGEVALSCQ